MNTDPNILAEKAEYNLIIKEDPRFEVSVRELKITLLFWGLTFILCALVSYSLFPKEPGGITLTAGFPTPIFWSIIVVPAVIIVATFLVIKYYFKDVPLDAYEGGEE